MAMIIMKHINRTFHDIAVCLLPNATLLRLASDPPVKARLQSEWNELNWDELNRSNKTVSFHCSWFEFNSCALHAPLGYGLVATSVLAFHSLLSRRYCRLCLVMFVLCPRISSQYFSSTVNLWRRQTDWDSCLACTQGGG